jgi:hypothetical protein
MKQNTKKAFFISFLLLTISSQVNAMGARRPKTPAPAPTPSAPPSPPPPPQASGPYVDQIKSMAQNSSCINYSWKNRGRAPAGYIKGVALSFARSLCRLNSFAITPSPLVLIMSKADSQNDAKDALTHYQNIFSLIPIKTNSAGLESLRATYALEMGLGMRESSGAYCEGWDKSAGGNRPSSAGEAGLFQTSYDSISSSIELSKLYNEYKTGPSSRCFLETYKQGASCSNSATLGTGTGADFQVFTKSCPAFASEYTATMLRIARAHYGPINRREAEVVPACNQLLINVEDLVNRDPNIACQDIN